LLPVGVGIKLDDRVRGALVVDHRRGDTVDNEMKAALGKIMGEVLRTQRRVAPDACNYESGTIYGLLNGVESTIDDVLFPEKFFVSNDEFNVAIRILDSYFVDVPRRNAVKGYNDLAPELERAGLSRGKMSVIITHLKAQRRFVELIEKFDTGNSPDEMRRFDIRDEEV
jgi:hypothetical protein